MSVHPSATNPAPQATPAAARPFVPLHKLRRRTATSVCAGDFDEVASPRGGVPKLTVLAGVATIDWMRAAHEEQVRQGLVLPGSQLAPVPDVNTIDHAHDLPAPVTQPYAQYYEGDSADELSPSPDDADDADYEDRDSDYQEQYHELPRPRRRSLSSAATSLTSARPRTPIDVDAMSPAAVISPTSPASAFPFAIVGSRRQTGSDALFPYSGKSSGKRIRARSTSSSEPDVPLSKRPKPQRVNSIILPSPTAHVAPRPSGLLPAVSSASAAPKPRVVKAVVPKGWKGWVTVEDMPEPTTLIKLDAPAPILPERRTRSGKNFDAIGVGNGSWINPS
ncbi:hypothetical protein AURDEDRAFT_111844 [Auricularia subglabra TFB-10046 SS5]|nr:hypothetical protein AURDEDRAFT_111844 [Auricularia subglabra TFB-10046 SS5]